MQAHHSQSRREVSSLQQQQDPGALYDFNLDEELEMDLDEETMEAMFGQDLASDTDILGMWIPEVLDWPTWVCVTLCYGSKAAITTLLFTSLHHFSLTVNSYFTCTLKGISESDTLTCRSALHRTARPLSCSNWHEVKEH